MASEIAKVGGGLTRRRLLQLTAVGAAGSLAACGGQQPGAPAVATANTAEWDAVVAAAKKEGKVSVMGAAGETYRQAQVTGFQQAYPEITVELTGLPPQKIFIWPQEVKVEQSQGRYLWDVHLNGDGPGGPFRVLRDGWAPLAGLLRPEIMDDSKWLDGWKAGWIDRDAKLWYSFQGLPGPSFYVNRKLAPESELSRVDQLIEPKWKDKIAFNDPRLGGSGSGVFTHLLRVQGEEWATKFLGQIRSIADSRQLSESMVRDQYPVGGGIQLTFVVEFLRQGLGKDLKVFDTDPEKGRYLQSGRGMIAVFAKAPHPNAARVYANWLLSKEGQTAWTTATTFTSRRRDVAVADDAFAFDPKAKYVIEDREEYEAVQSKAFELANKYVK